MATWLMGHASLGMGSVSGAFPVAKPFGSDFSIGMFPKQSS
jgi:hypothetical protein